MSKSVLPLKALGAAALLILSELGFAGTSVSAVALDEDSIRININGSASWSNCLPTRITPNRNGEFLSGVNYAAGTPWVTLHDLDGGTYFFRVRYCSGVATEPLTITEETNTVTLDSPIPEPPASVSVIDSDGAGNYTITWSASNNALDYEIAQRIHDPDTWQQGAPPQWSDWGGYFSNGSGLFKVYVNMPANVYQYRVRACNGSGCSLPTLSPPVIVEAPDDVGVALFMPDARVRAIWTAPEGCLVLFEGLPDACETSFSNAHALIPFENRNHEKMYSQVFMAKATGKRIDLWFEDNGDCDSLSTLMAIDKIEIIDTPSARSSSKGGANNE